MCISNIPRPVRRSDAVFSWPRVYIPLVLRTAALYSGNTSFYKAAPWSQPHHQFQVSSMTQKCPTGHRLLWQSDGFRRTYVTQCYLLGLTLRFFFLSMERFFLSNSVVRICITRVGENTALAWSESRKNNGWETDLAPRLIYAWSPQTPVFSTTWAKRAHSLLIKVLDLQVTNRLTKASLLSSVPYTQRRSCSCLFPNNSGSLHIDG